MSDYSIDGLIRYFQMAHKVMGWKSTDNSYEHHVAEMLKKLRDERDEARREAMLLLSDRASTKEMNAEYKKRGWEYLKENTDVKV